MKANDIDERPILEFLQNNSNIMWATRFRGFENSLPIPDNVPPKVLLAKMSAMIRKGFVSGCDCGCRGDFEITELGKKQLEIIRASAPTCKDSCSCI